MIACEAHTCHSYRVLSSINRILTCPRRPNARMTLMSHWPSTANLNIADPTSSRFASRTIQESAVSLIDFAVLLINFRGTEQAKNEPVARVVVAAVQLSLRRFAANAASIGIFPSSCPLGVYTQSGPECLSLSKFCVPFSQNCEVLMHACYYCMEIIMEIPSESGTTR